MKKKILVCTIMRNQEDNILIWRNQLERLIQNCPEYDFTISVYENDSTDLTKEYLDSIRESFIILNIDFIIKCENIGTQKYGSVWSLDRIKNLANARQRCIDQVGHLNFDKIAFIEPDIEYDPNWCKELILAKHPEQASIVPHIYSAWSLRSSFHPKESSYLYDTCATRQTDKDVCWNFDKESEWKGKTLVKTHFSDIDSNCLHYIWSTFNCFCVYDIRPFKEGLKWNFINKRLNTRQEWLEIGWLDADTSVICEDFRIMGFYNILINTNCLTRHI